MTTEYNVAEIIAFTRKINCMTYDDFKGMYKFVFGPLFDGYVREKFNLVQNGFNRWICSLDYEVLEAMMNYCLNK